MRELKLEENTMVFFLSDNGGPPLHHARTTRSRLQVTMLEGASRAVHGPVNRHDSGGKTDDRPVISRILPTAMRPSARRRSVEARRGQPPPFLTAKTLRGPTRALRRLGPMGGPPRGFQLVAARGRPVTAPGLYNGAGPSERRPERGADGEGEGTSGLWTSGTPSRPPAARPTRRGGRRESSSAAAGRGQTKRRNNDPHRLAAVAALPRSCDCPGGASSEPAPVEEHPVTSSRDEVERMGCAGHRCEDAQLDRLAAKARVTTLRTRSHRSDRTSRYSCHEPLRPVHGVTTQRTHPKDGQVMLRPLKHPGTRPRCGELHASGREGLRLRYFG